MDLWI